MITFSKIFLFFIIYSCLGWCLEVITMFVKTGKFVNCGTLIGPYCPIYGIVAILILTLTSSTNNPIVIFIISLVSGAFIEYVASYIIETLWNIKWWDYSHLKFNLNGRICLGMSIIFGLLGIIVKKFINPPILFLINSMPKAPTIIIFSVIFILFICDIIFSQSLMKNLRNTNSLKLDTYTNKITKLIQRKKKSI